MIGWPFMRWLSRTKRLCGVHLRARRGNTFSLECMAGNPPAHHAIDEWLRSGGDRGRQPMPDISFHREHVSSFPASCLPTGQFRQILLFTETKCSLAVCRSGVGRHSRHFRTDGALAGSIAANSAALFSAIRQIRLQPHEFEVLAQCFLVLTETFADLAQTLPRLLAASGRTVVRNRNSRLAAAKSPFAASNRPSWCNASLDGVSNTVGMQNHARRRSPERLVRRMQAGLFDRNGFVAKDVHIERYSKRRLGGCSSAITARKRTFWLLSC